MPRVAQVHVRTSISLSAPARATLTLIAKAGGTSTSKGIRAALLLHALAKYGKRPARHDRVIPSRMYGSNTETIATYLRPDDMRALDILGTYYNTTNRSILVEVALLSERDAAIAYYAKLTPSERTTLAKLLPYPLVDRTPRTTT